MASSQTELLAEKIIPTIDFGVLVNGTPDQRSGMVQTLAKACEDWGFFMLLNHGMPDRLSDEMLEAFTVLFEKCWKHYVKIFVHPEFHSVPKPLNFRDISKDYSECTRAIGLELLKAIWEGLGMEESHINEALKLGSCFQNLTGNLYPPYQNPDIKFGFVPHSDHGLLTLLYQNGVDGLQIKHQDRWVSVRPLPNSIMVNTCDHLEIVTNGKYKAVLHRVLLNTEVERMSVATTIGPSLDAIVEPIPDLMNEDFPAVFRGIKYRDYLEQQQSNSLVEKGALNLVRLS
ncbi:hypothetical protein LUZ63_000319 [Rhynchospora breviuscula]|uniref:Fe2OG dioxygenase domain-containing protein n=1 Tax=Rhynchospora breviuscula TaxID=2022672 RepID=A0A9Q0CUU0_9POAL|nr:hypothetical protein LUZ63_000319 [Rhynchospora breviuscula]